jgi:transcriptional regulator with XRE-family HTH domain
MGAARTGCGTLFVMHYNNTVNQAAELVRKMRLNSGQPLRELARRAKTSAPALVDYEAGRHEPRLSTLQRLAEASGCDLIVELRPRLTPPELRTLAMHEAVVQKLHEDPELVLRKARAQLLVMRNADSENRASVYLRTWSRLLEGPIDELTAVMVSTDQPARDLRQSSPFGGVLSNKERLDVIRRAVVHP